jgi:hypothetical protein
MGCGIAIPAASWMRLIASQGTEAHDQPKNKGRRFLFVALVYRALSACHYFGALWKAYTSISAKTGNCIPQNAKACARAVYWRDNMAEIFHVARSCHLIILMRTTREPELRPHLENNPEQTDKPLSSQKFFMLLAPVI